MKTKMEKSSTVHGDVEYEVVECSNCESTMRVEDAIPAGVGIYKSKCSRSICPEESERFAEKIALCEYCAENLFGYTQGIGSGMAPLIRDMDGSSAFQLGMFTAGLLLMTTVTLAFMGGFLWQVIQIAF
jgi:hypothetical protein